MKERSEACAVEITCWKLPCAALYWFPQDLRHKKMCHLRPTRMGSSAAAAHSRGNRRSLSPPRRTLTPHRMRMTGAQPCAKAMVYAGAVKESCGRARAQDYAQRLVETRRDWQRLAGSGAHLQLFRSALSLSSFALSHWRGRRFRGSLWLHGQLDGLARQPHFLTSPLEELELGIQWPADHEASAW